MFALTAITANRLEVDLQTRREAAPSGSAPPYPHPPGRVKTTPHTPTPRPPPLSAEAHLADHRRSPPDKCVNFTRAAEFEMDLCITILLGFGYAAEGFEKPISDIPGSCFG